jgi:hypothetical protein
LLHGRRVGSPRRFFAHPFSKGPAYGLAPRLYRTSSVRSTRTKRPVLGLLLKTT